MSNSLLPLPELGRLGGALFIVHYSLLIVFSVRKGWGMIRITRLNKTELIVNADLIEFIEATPDTIITLTTGQKLIASEPVEEIIERVIAFRRRITIPE